MIEKNYYFMCGIPRSGSTLLLSILNQNKTLYGTSTSPLLDLLCFNEYSWRNCQSVIANPVSVQLENISESIINGCWKHIPQTIIIDKHRGWGRNLNTIEKIFKKNPKAIATVRDIPSVLASFLQLLRNSNQSVTYVDRILLKKHLPLTDENRVDVLWNDFITDSWESLKVGFSTKRDSLILVDYDELINNNDEIMKKVYDFLELPYFHHNINDIKNETNENDLIAWGLENLHKIRPTLEKTCKSPEEVLGKKIFNKYVNMNLEFWK